MVSGLNYAALLVSSFIIVLLYSDAAVHAFKPCLACNVGGVTSVDAFESFVRLIVAVEHSCVASALEIEAHDSFDLI